MAAQLNEPLAVGESYYVVFHASMCDFSEKINRLCATNNLGLRFFKDPNYTAFPPDANPLQPDNFAHINYSEILSDSINWIAIDGWFTADDSYDWIAIGNFFTDSETETEVLNDSELCSGVYYIENVCVGSSQSDCEYLLSEKNRGEQIFGSLFPNPATNVVTLQIDTRGFFDVEITDLQGRVLLRYNEVRNGDVFDVSSFQKGIYVVRVSNDKYFSSFKLFIT
jgi:hypothetical protein